MNDLQTGSSETPSLETLIRRFREAEAALDAVLNGQVDAVIDPVTAIPILLQDAQLHLQASEARYRHLLTRNAMVVFELEADGTTLFVNDAVVEVLGYTAAEMLGRNWWDILLVGVQHRQINDLYLRFQAGDVTQHELIMTTRQGSPTIVELSTVNRRRRDGTLDRILGLVVDVTERRNVEHELLENHAFLERMGTERMDEYKRANDTLRNLAALRQRLLEIEQAALVQSENANKMKLQFLSIISHELRTPLTSIKGFASTLLATDVTWDAESQHEFLTTIDQESDHMTALIEELLDLSQLEAGTLRIRPEQWSLNAIITSAMAQLQTVTAQHQLIINVPSDLPLILADMQRIAGVLVNLVGNGAKFSPSGTRITISAVQLGDNIRVDVSDEGIGIAVEDREKVFVTFWQHEYSVSPSAQGIGLGLAICRGIIMAHGGDIWVADKTAGTTLSFTLPTASTADDD